MTTSVETFEFQSEARQLLQLMVHSVYSNRDVFLRELVSNASDALDKLRLESFRDKELTLDTTDLHIDIEIDGTGRTLTVRDNGIGMSRDEVIGLIGTIARSGTTEFLAKLAQAQGTARQDLIGQFGVGFYASFMVADRVVLLTRRAGTDDGVRWESDGDGTYTIEPADDAPQGTSVILHLKPEDAEDQFPDYTSPAKIRQIIKRYSDFITWPIRLVGEAGGDTEAAEPINSMKALWARPSDDVTEDEYRQFYRSISHDWNNPLDTIRVAAEGAFEYQALLFVPAQAPPDLYLRQRKSGIGLYVKRVFIMDDCDALMPEYLRFIKGVVDAQDLSLNMSRELLQQNRQIQLIRRRLVKRVLATVKTLMSNKPESYATFWRQFGSVVKEGLLSDPDNRESILEISSFASTRHPEETTTLRAYIERMKDGQEQIYFMTGDSRTSIENSPHLEAFQEKGVEVLLLTDPVDEIWVDTVGEFDGKHLQSTAKGQVDLDTGEEGDAESRESLRQREDFAALLAWMTTTLGEEVREVRLSTRLTTSPACVVSDANDPTPTLEKIYRNMGQPLPKVKRVLELNPHHPLIAGLHAAHRKRPDDERLAATAELVYGTALIAEGGELADPVRFTRLLAEQLERAL